MKEGGSCISPVYDVLIYPVLSMSATALKRKTADLSCVILIQPSAPHARSSDQSAIKQFFALFIVPCVVSSLDEGMSETPVFTLYHVMIVSCFRILSHVSCRAFFLFSLSVPMPMFFI